MRYYAAPDEEPHLLDDPPHSIHSSSHNKEHLVGTAAADEAMDMNSDDDRDIDIESDVSIVFCVCVCVMEACCVIWGPWAS